MDLGFRVLGFRVLGFRVLGFRGYIVVGRVSISGSTTMVWESIPHSST